MIKYTQKKWESFTDSKKRNILTASFLKLEQALQHMQATLQSYEEFCSLLELLESEGSALLPEFKRLAERLDFKGLKQEIADKRKIYQQYRENFNDEIVGQKDFHFLPVISQQDSEKDAPKLPVILILDNLRSAFNVGSIFRTAECLNIEEVWCCGYTPTPNSHNVQNTAMGTEKYVAHRHFGETKEAIVSAQEKGFTVYALETVVDCPTIYEADLSGNIAFVLGNEALGIDPKNIVLCDGCLQLPISGWKNSLNVAVACAVACFEAQRQIVESTSCC
ncbi:MAG: RNA methyltransferase [Candidatus Cloacimonetes bacterium]|nr:RNA methyltransferase [Candidatus Cloacimonadota bacterium]